MKSHSLVYNPSSVFQTQTFSVAAYRFLAALVILWLAVGIPAVCLQRGKLPLIEFLPHLAHTDGSHCEGSSCRVRHDKSSEVPVLIGQGLAQTSDPQSFISIKIPDTRVNWPRQLSVPPPEQPPNISKYS